MGFEKEKFDQLVNKSDIKWYREMIRNSPFSRKINQEKENELIDKSMKQAEAFKSLLIETYGIKDQPMSYMISLDVPLDYVKEEASYGVQYLGYYSLKSKKITINFSAINLILKNIRRFKLDQVNQEKLKDTILMHELFHHLEEMYPESYTKQKHLDTKIFGLFNSKVTLSLVGEIAAVHFSKIMTDLPHSPLLYNEIYKLK